MRVQSRAFRCPVSSSHCAALAALSLAVAWASAAGAQTFALTPSADTYIRGGSPNKAGGTSNFLRVQEAGPNRVLLRFDQGGVAGAVGGGRLVSATLELSVQAIGNNWGSEGRTIDAHRITADWTEVGATWNCPSDSQPSNASADCTTQWAGGAFEGEPSDSVLHTSGSTGWVGFDVTADVAAFLAGTPNFGWLLDKGEENAPGQVDYNSREATEQQPPRLVLLVENVADDIVPPQLTITAPTAPALVGSATPEISASYSDGGRGIDLATLQVKVDGADITASCNRTSSAATCTPPSLATGSHAILVSIADLAGNVATASGSFQLFLGSGPHTLTVPVIADTTLRGGAPNQASGGEITLDVRHAGPRRSLLRIDQAALATLLEGAQLVSATLDVYIETNGNNWGAAGRPVGAHRVLAPWTEAGASWNCPIDGTPSNSLPDCASVWNGGSFSATPTSTVVHTQGLLGWIHFDVTADVEAFLAGTANNGWELVKADERASGLASYGSREGSSAHAPRLALVFLTPVSETTPPTISGLQPADGALLASPTPSIAAAWADDSSGVDPASLDLRIDGTVRTGANVTAAGFTFSPSPPLPDGQHSVDVAVADRAGNRTSAHAAFTTDATAPALWALLPGEASLVAAPAVTAGFTDATSGVDDATLRLLVDGQDVTGSSTVANGNVTFSPIPALPDGVHTAEVSVRDRAGNLANASSTFTVDSSPPLIHFMAPAGDVVGEASPPVAFAYEDAGGIEVASLRAALDGVDLAGCSFNSDHGSCTLPALSHGSYHGIVVTALDAAGNLGTGSVDFSIDLDHEAPRVAITSPAEGAITRFPVIAVTGTATDDLELTRAAVNGQSVAVSGDGSVATTVELEEGTNAIELEAVDGSGKRSRAAITVLEDAIPPTIRIETPEPGEVTNEATIEFLLKVADRSGIAQVEVTGQPATFMADGTVHGMLSLVQGLNEINIRVIDVAGNEAETTLEVSRFDLPTVTIEAPVDLSYLPQTAIDVSGTVSESTATVTVNGVAATVVGNVFTASTVPLVEGGNTITATATTVAGHVGIASVNVVRDLTAPRVEIYYPRPGIVRQAVIPVGGLVNDIVRGTVNAGEVAVSVNGQPAQVANRSFLLPALSLAAGENTVTVVARDASGNEASTEVRVTYQPATGPSLRIVSGDLQSAPVLGALPSPLVVECLTAEGAPLANQRVLFKAVDNGGSFDNGKRSILLASGADGRAAAHFTLGNRAGVANQVVQASAVGIGTPVVFHFSGQIGQPHLIVVDSGDQQVGLAGELLPRPLVAAVVDAGFNRVAGVPVKFSVHEGGGSLAGGQSETLVDTDSDGRAIVTFATGPRDGNSNNVVAAEVAGLPAAGVAVFGASGWAAGDAAQTTIQGLVLDNSNQPVPGASVRVRDTSLVAQASPEGVFRIAPAPVGRVKLIVDGSTTTRPGTWPDLEFELTTIPGRDNDLGMPVYLLPLDEGSRQFVDETHGGTLSLPEMPGFALDIAPGSVTFPIGSHSGVVSVTVVHSDRVPMAPNFGQQPRLIVTIQPPGARFDPPARMTLPNLEGLSPGAVTEMYSFDHDLGHFVSIGPATVSDDGMVIRSNPGVGIVKGGWHCGGDPRAVGVQADCKDCRLCDGISCALFAPTNTSCTLEPANACAVGFCADGACNAKEFFVKDLKVTADPMIQALGEPIVFEVTHSDAFCAQQLEYEWDFGDGSIPQRTALNRISYVYSRNGEFGVAVKAYCGPCPRVLDRANERVVVVELKGLSVVSGATRDHFIGDDNWGTLANGKKVVFLAEVEPTVPPDALRDLIEWSGAQERQATPQLADLVAGQPARMVEVTARLGSVEKRVELWIMWADLDLRSSGSVSPDNSSDQLFPGLLFPLLGLVTDEDHPGLDAEASAHVEIVGHVLPIGVDAVLDPGNSGWTMTQHLSVVECTNGVLGLDSGDDSPNSSRTDFSPSPQSNIFFLDAPTVGYQLQQPTFIHTVERYMNFVVYAWWRGPSTHSDPKLIDPNTVGSDRFVWYFRALVDDDLDQPSDPSAPRNLHNRDTNSLSGIGARTALDLDAMVVSGRCYYSPRP